MTWTEEQINEIIGLKADDGASINVFELYGVLHIGNTTKGLWTLIKKFTKHGEGRLAVSLGDFEDCEDDEEVRDTFSELIEERVKAKLV